MKLKLIGVTDLLFESKGLRVDENSVSPCAFPLMANFFFEGKKYPKSICSQFTYLLIKKSFLETLSRLSRVTFNIVANGYRLEIFIEGLLNNVNDYEYVTS